MALILPK